MVSTRLSDHTAWAETWGGARGDGPPENLRWGDGGAYIPPIFQQELQYQCKISASVMIDSHCPNIKS